MKTIFSVKCSTENCFDINTPYKRKQANSRSFIRSFTTIYNIHYDVFIRISFIVDENYCAASFKKYYSNV